MDANTKLVITRALQFLFQGHRGRGDQADEGVDTGGEGRGRRQLGGEGDGAGARPPGGAGPLPRHHVPQGMD